MLEQTTYFGGGQYQPNHLQSHFGLLPLMTPNKLIQIKDSWSLQVKQNKYFKNKKKPDGMFSPPTDSHVSPPIC